MSACVRVLRVSGDIRPTLSPSDANRIQRGPDRRGSHDVCYAPTHSTGAADVLVQGRGAVVVDELDESPDYEAASTSSRAQCTATRPSVAGGLFFCVALATT